MQAVLRRGLGRVARALGLRRWFKRVTLVIVRRDLSQEDYPLPPGRQSPMGDPADFYLDHATDADVATFLCVFPARKVEQLRREFNNPDTDCMLRAFEDRTGVWCYMMHSQKRFQDPEYGFTIPICEGRDIHQWDGWVEPNYRGLMIGILGTNYANQLRQAEGFERLYATLREKDARTLRLHDRLGYRPVGKVRHLRIGPFRWNRVDFEPGEYPTDCRGAPREPSRLGIPIQPSVRSGPIRAGYTFDRREPEGKVGILVGRKGRSTS